MLFGISWYDWLIGLCVSSIFWGPVAFFSWRAFRSGRQAREERQALEQKMKAEGTWPGVWVLRPGDSLTVDPAGRPRVHRFDENPPPREFPTKIKR